MNGEATLRDLFKAIMGADQDDVVSEILVAEKRVRIKIERNDWCKTCDDYGLVGGCDECGQQPGLGR